MVFSNAVHAKILASSAIYSTPEENKTVKEGQRPSPTSPNISKIQDYPQVLGSPDSHNASRHPRGYWAGTDTGRLYEKFTDNEFAENLPRFLKEEKCSSVIDVGAGNGIYTQKIADSGIFVNCYDGNPDTQMISNGRCAILDFSQAINLPCQYDWVLSLKVGKHIPKEFEETFVQNLHRMNRRGVIINWGGPTTATPNTPKDVKYFNHQSDSYIIQKFESMGYIHDSEAEKKLRSSAKDATLRSRLLVFRKPEVPLA